MSELFELIGFCIFSATKFLMAPPAMIIFGYAVVKSILVSFIGGFLGLIFFFYVGKALFSLVRLLVGNKKRKQFTRRNRLIIKYKSKIGVLGLSMLIPLISVPITAILVSKYYQLNYKTVASFGFSTFFWSVVLSYLSFGFKTLFLK
jgi:hypothetical protein